MIFQTLLFSNDSFIILLESTSWSKTFAQTQPSYVWFEWKILRFWIIIFEFWMI